MVAPTPFTLPRFTLFLFAASVLFAPPARAQEVVVELDPAQTEIHFTLGATLHTVHGTFKLKRGLIRYDISTGKAAGEIIVDAASGNSANDSRDRKMHADFLESQKFPEIAFLPDSVQVGLAPSKDAPQNVSQLQFHGLFKLHGSAHELTLTAQVQKIDGRPSATLHFVVPYVQWGLKNPSTFILRVSDKVDIDIHTSALLKPL
jgi:polyisoprenoid-binding protein YceI